MPPETFIGGHSHLWWAGPPFVTGQDQESLPYMSGFRPINPPCTQTPGLITWLHAHFVVSRGLLTSGLFDLDRDPLMCTLADVQPLTKLTTAVRLVAYGIS